MYLIGESLNVISTKIGTAYKERDPKPIQEEALHQKKMGMDYIDINLGPAKKDGHELMPWVVEVVQDVVPDVPLALDTSNIGAIEAALKVYKETPNPPIINSIMARTARYEKMIPLAAEYNADVIALMWGPDGLPRDEHERGALAAELMNALNEAGVSNDRVWIDGIVTPVNIQQPQLISLMNFMTDIHDMFPGVKSTCGLSNISNGPPEHLRLILNTTYMIMLERYGMYSVISDPLDETLTEIAKGGRMDIVNVVYDAMDAFYESEPYDISGLSKELQDHAKTANVILGVSLYSDSWLEV